MQLRACSCLVVPESLLFPPALQMGENETVEREFGRLKPPAQVNATFPAKGYTPHTAGKPGKLRAGLTHQTATRRAAEATQFIDNTDGIEKGMTMGTRDLYPLVTGGDGVTTGTAKERRMFLFQSLILILQFLHPLPPPGCYHLTQLVRKAKTLRCRIG